MTSKRRYNKLVVDYEIDKEQIGNLCKLLRKISNDVRVINFHNCISIDTIRIVLKSMPNVFLIKFGQFIGNHDENLEQEKKLTLFNVSRSTVGFLIKFLPKDSIDNLCFGHSESNVSLTKFFAAQRNIKKIEAWSTTENYLDEIHHLKLEKFDGQFYASDHEKLVELFKTQKNLEIVSLKFRDCISSIKLTRIIVELKKVKKLKIDIDEVSPEMMLALKRLRHLEEIDLTIFCSKSAEQTIESLTFTALPAMKKLKIDCIHDNLFELVHIFPNLNEIDFSDFKFRNKSFVCAFDFVQSLPKLAALRLEFDYLQINEHDLERLETLARRETIKKLSFGVFKMGNDFTVSDRLMQTLKIVIDNVPRFELKFSSSSLSHLRPDFEAWQ
jgi:hypothetical protein